MTVMCSAKDCISNKYGLCQLVAIELKFNCMDAWAPACQDYQIRVDEEGEEEDDDAY